MHEKFKIAFGGLELIPNGQFIRVIALAVKSGYLETLRKEIVKTVGGESHPAHLTLARVSNVAEKKKFVDVIKEIKCEEKNMLVGDICLIQSTLQKHGPLYTVLHKSYLK